MEFFHKQTNFPFMATRKVWYGLSAVLMIICFASFAVRGLNYALDFTGGVSVGVTFSGAADVEKVRTALESANFHEPQVQTFGSSREVSVRLQPILGGAGEPIPSDVIRERLVTALKPLDANVVVAPPDVVGPQVGSELRNSAIWALTFTLLLIFAYLAVRFHTWRLSAGAILAVMHDPILVLGVFSITQTPFDLAVVAAILAVIGYSLNDTVVVFDRIRERFEKSRRLAPAVVLDQAINQTLSRTIMTKVVTSIVVIALLFLGGPVLRGFSEALLIGIIAGTYSSIYISASVALDCGLTAEHVFPSVKKSAVDHLP
ncbi:MAG: protein translocase subunit SecF [Gammaproteobacteria bacterium]